MAWLDSGLPTVRAMLGDTGTVPTYSDDQIEQTLVIAASHVVMDAASVGFDYAYVADIAQITITPDPTDSASLDTDFFNLMCMKAACIISYGAAVKTSGQAIRIKDGASEIDLREASKARLQAAKEGWCGQYKAALALYITNERNSGNAGPNGRLVVTPIRIY